MRLLTRLHAIASMFGVPAPAHKRTVRMRTVPPRSHLPEQLRIVPRLTDRRYSRSHATGAKGSAVTFLAGASRRDDASPRCPDSVHANGHPMNVACSPATKRLRPSIEPITAWRGRSRGPF